MQECSEGTITFIHQDSDGPEKEETISFKKEGIARQRPPFAVGDMVYFQICSLNHEGVRHAVNVSLSLLQSYVSLGIQL